MSCDCGKHNIALHCPLTLVARAIRSGNSLAETVFVEAVRQWARWGCSMDPMPPKDGPGDALLVSVVEIVHQRFADEKDLERFGHTAEAIANIASDIQWGKTMKDDFGVTP